MTVKLEEIRDFPGWVPAVVPVEPSELRADPALRRLEQQATEATARFYRRYAELFDRPTPQLRRAARTAHELRRLSRELDAARAERDVAEERLLARRDELIAVLESAR